MARRDVERESARLIDAFVLEGVDRVRAADLIKTFVDRLGFGRPPKVPAEHPELPAIFAFYRDQYHARVGEDPLCNWAEAAGIVTKLLRIASVQTIQQRLFAFFHTPTPFVKQRGFAWSAFASEWNQLAVREQDDRPWREECVRQQHEPPCATQWAHERRKGRG